MKKKLVISAIVVIITAVTIYLINNNSRNTEKGEGKKQLYTCGMHPQIISEEPGLCPICEMKLTPIKNQNNNTVERKVLFYRNPMNPNVTSPTPMKDEMGMDYVPVYENEAAAEGIVTIDPRIQQNMNIKIAKVEKRKLSSKITTNGVLLTDETKDYIVTIKVDGWVEKLFVNFTGQQVNAGSKLMEIYSPTLVSAQQEFITALDYQKSTHNSSLSDIQNSSEELVKNAFQKLQLLNVSSYEIERLKETREVKTSMILYAQKSGTVLEKNIVEGQKIMAGEPLLKISNLSNLWLTAEIYEREIPKIKLGSSAQIKFNFSPEKTYSGKVTFIYPVIDEKSRTVKVRIEVPNHNGELKPAMFANVEISGPETEAKPVVPENSVIRSGKRDLVIVALGDGKFKPQMVTLGVYSDGYYQVKSGLNEGDNIVTSAQFLIDSESNLRAAINQFQDETSAQDQHEKSQSNKMLMQDKTGMNEKENESQKTKNNSMDYHSHDKHEQNSINKVIDVESMDKNRDGKLFECPMDWDVISDEAGRCPLCNMKLKEYSLSDVKSNLEKHGFKHK